MCLNFVSLCVVEVVGPYEDSWEYFFMDDIEEIQIRNAREQSQNVSS